MTNPAISSPTDLQSLGLLIAFQTSAIEARDKNSEDSKRWG
jgi:hypothetical protein